MNAQLNISALMSALLYGILAFIVFGCLMVWLPKKYALSPMHYGRYNSVYLFMFIALFMLETGALISSELVTAGMILLVPGWLIALQGMKNMFDWMPSKSQGISSVIVFMLLAIFVSLLASIIAHVSDHYQHMVITLSSVSLILWLMIMPVFKVLLSKAPLNARVVLV